MKKFRKYGKHFVKEENTIKYETRTVSFKFNRQTCLSTDNLSTKVGIKTFISLRVENTPVLGEIKIIISLRVDGSNRLKGSTQNLAQMFLMRSQLSVVTFHMD